MSEITEDLYQNGENIGRAEIGFGERTSTEEAVIVITNLEIAKLRHENALLRRQAELHEATRDRLREQRDAAIARVRRLRDLLDAGY